MGSPVRPESTATADPVAAYLAKYEKGGSSQIPQAAPAESTQTVDPVAAYHAKYSAPASPPGGGSMADALASGLSLGLSPKLGAVLSAGEDLVKNRSLSHAAQAYDTALAENQQHLTAVNKRAPGVAAAVRTVGEVVPTAALTLVGGNPALRSALSLPAEIAPEAGGMLSRIGQTMRVGAGTGAVLSGAQSTGTLKERLQQTARGGLAGAALGAGGQIVGGEIAPALVRSGKAMVTPIATRAANTAEKQLATAFSNDGGIEAALQRGLADDAIGAPSLVAHTGGRNVNNLVWKSVNTPSEGGTTLANALSPIKEGEGAVLSRGLGEVSGVGDASAFAKTKQIQNQQQLSAHQLYGTALGQAPVDDPAIFQTIASHPKLVDAAKRSLSILEGRGVATDADRQAVQALQSWHPQGASTAATATPRTGAPRFAQMEMASIPDGVPTAATAAAPVTDQQALFTKLLAVNGGDEQAASAAMRVLGSKPPEGAHQASYPLSVQLLHTMKRGADDLIQAGLAKDATFTNLDAQNMNGAVQSILSRIDQHVPAYAQARLVYKNDADRLDAIAAGGEALNLSPEEIAATKAALVPQNHSDYTLGAVDAFRQKMAQKTPGSTVTNTVFGPQVAKDRLAAILGDEGRAAYEPYFDYGQRVEATHQRAFLGSSTSGNENIKAEDATPDYGLGVRGLLSHRRALMAAAQRFTNLQRKGFQGAVADQLGQRLAVPAGTPDAEAIYNRLRETRDENSADALAQAAIRLLRLRNALGVAGGVGASNR